MTTRTILISFSAAGVLVLLAVAGFYSQALSTQSFRLASFFEASNLSPCVVNTTKLSPGLPVQLDCTRTAHPAYEVQMRTRVQQELLGQLLSTETKKAFIVPCTFHMGTASIVLIEQASQRLTARYPVAIIADAGPDCLQ